MKRMILPLILLAAAACADGGVPPTEGALFDGSPAHTDGALVPPSPFVQDVAGNFVAVDDLAICEAILGAGATTEMFGFKIDPPANHTIAGVLSFSITGGKFLSWEAYNGTEILAVVVKGGPNYRLYNYFGAGLLSLTSDVNLHSPPQRNKIPDISHYNVCYRTPPGGDGCTPGYWRNHADRWPAALSPADDFDATFGIELFDPNITLGAAIWAGGGGSNAFARHATAALLNAYAKVDGSNGQFVDYPYDPATVIAMVQEAFADGTLDALKTTFETANEAGCPLSGTPAVPVVP